jgi:rhamnose transport system substrate-binding protein
MRSHRSLLAGVATLALMLGVTVTPALGQDATASPGNAPAGATVGLIPKAVTIAFFDFVNKGATEAAAELGGQAIYNGPTQPLGPEQIPFVNQFANQLVDCIAIAGDDPNAVAPGLKRAMESGIKVVSYDSDVAADARNIFVADSTDDLIARTQVQMLGEQMGYEGEFAILSTTPTTTNQVTWINIMLDELTKPEYANMKLVQTAYGEGVVDKAAQATDGLLKGFPNLKGILAPDVPAGVGAAQEIEKAGKSGQIALTGLFLPSLMLDFVKNGTVKEFILYNPSDVGYLTQYACDALASGQITGAVGDTFVAGKLGERTVGENGIVVLGAPTKFNKDNIESAGF